MIIHSVFDPEFRPYGRVLEGYDTEPLLSEMRRIPLPHSGVAYEASISSLEALPAFSEFRDRGYGGMPIELGMCWGYNTRMNCLEYHRDSELNIGETDFIMLLGKRENIIGGKLDTATVEAFFSPKGIVVEVFATSLHYAACGTDESGKFRVAIVLPRGTNSDKPDIVPQNDEDAMLWARNKWLLAHPETDEAKQGAYIGLIGENIDLRK